MRIEQYDIERTFQAKVVATERITAEDTQEVRDITLAIDHHAFDFRVGQSIGLVLHGPHEEFGHPHHFRLYTVADTPKINEAMQPEVRICVKRCDYIDEYSGERYQGTASNYLCDRKVGDVVTVCGPFGSPFPLPEDKTSTLILVGMGTGIAPFRAFVKHIYEDIQDWQGKVILLHGARSGLELLYQNDQQDDFTQYLDKGTFTAIQALSSRPHWTDPMSVDFALEDRADEILSKVLEDNAYIYVAGREEIAQALDHVFAGRVGPDAAWHSVKQELKDNGRWVELIY